MNNLKDFEYQINELEKQFKGKTPNAKQMPMEPETPAQEEAEYNVPSLLSPRLKTALMRGLTQELVQSSLWKSLANQMQYLGFFGTQKYFLKESEEELGHYQIIVDFMNDLGDMADVPAIEAPTAKVEEIGDALVVAYNKEVEVYNLYKEIYAIAQSEDAVVAQFLLQFLNIQKEAVGAYGDLIATYKTANRTGEILEFDEHING